MKKVLFILLLPLLLFFACDLNSDSGSDDEDSSDTETTLTTTPDAEAADDGKATGIYKGVIADEDTSGTFMIDIDNVAQGRADGDVYNATLYLEVEGTTLTSTGTATEQADGSFLVDITITIIGIVFEFDLDISSTGTVNDVTVLADGTPIVAVADKEESDALLEAWEGTFAGDESGVWNFIIEETDIEGVYSGTPGTGSFYGSISSSSVNLVIESSYSGTGTISGYSITGAWNVYGESGTWSGTRTR